MFSLWYYHAVASILHMKTSAGTLFLIVFTKLHVLLSADYISILCAKICWHWTRIVGLTDQYINSYCDKTTGCYFPALRYATPSNWPLLPRSMRASQTCHLYTDLWRHVALDFMLGNSRTKLPLAGELTYGKCSFRWHIRRILRIIFTYATKFRHSKLIFTNYLQIILQNIVSF